jgi:hypothetical protein
MKQQTEEAPCDWRFDSGRFYMEMVSGKGAEIPVILI